MNAVYQKKVELQQAFGVSATTVQNWANDPEFPGGKRGPWVHSQVELYVRERQQSEGGGNDARAEQIKEATRLARLKILNEQGRKLAFGNDRDARKLIDKDDMAVEVEESYAKIRDRLLTLPDQLSAAVPAEAKAATIAQTRMIVHRLLNEMAGWEQRLTE